MSGMKMILKNSGWMGGEQMLRLIAGLFIGVWIARHLGPVDYGMLSFALSFCSLIGILATLGLNRATVRELTLLSGDEAGTARMVTSVVALRLLCSLVCVTIAVSISLLFSQGNPALIGILAFTMTFTSFDTLDLYFQSQTKSRISVLAKSAAFFSFLIVKIALLLAGAPVVAFAIATTLEAAASATALFIAFRRHGPPISLATIDLRHSLQQVRESWPEIFAGFASLLFMRVDQILLGNLIGPEAVGVYSVAVRLAESWYFIPMALIASSFPAIVRLREVDRAAYMQGIHNLTLTLVIISYAAAIVVTLIGKPVMLLLFGEAYAESGSVLIILIWGGVFITLGSSSGSWIMAERRPMLNLTRNAAGAVASIGLNLLLIPRYGVVGAAYGTVMAYSVAFFWSDFLGRDMRQIAIIKVKSLFLIRR